MRKKTYQKEALIGTNFFESILIVKINTNTAQEKEVSIMERVATVADLKPMQKGVVIKVNRRGALGKRLAEMGVGPGTLVELERVAPLGDPIDIKVKGYHLSLRKNEAADIVISVK